MRLTRIAALAATFALSLSLAPVTPANAYEAVTIGTPDVSTPGHVKVRVSSADAPYLSLTIGDEVQIKAVTGGYADFDLETWGFGDALLRANACSQWGCGGSETYREFTASQAIPSVQWSDDHIIGPGEDLLVTISDPAGGGELHASGLWDSQLLNRNGPSIIELDDFTGNVTLSRCASDGRPCHTISSGIPVIINRSFNLSASEVTPTLISPDGTAGPDVTLTLATQDDLTTTTGPVTVDWAVHSLPAEAVIMSGQTTIEPSTPSTVQLPLDLEGLPDGQYRISGSSSAPFEDIGTVTGALGGDSRFTVDLTPVTELMGPNFDTFVFPYPDGLANKARLQFGSQEPISTRVTITDSHGTVTRVLQDGLANDHDIVWNGTDSRGAISYGEHTVTITTIDEAGNTADAYTGPLTVYPHEWVKVSRNIARISAVNTVARWAGPCSSFSSPSSHRWKKSLGLNTQTKCRKKSWRKSGISAVYRSALPLNSFRVAHVKIRAYGAGGKSRPRSLAYLQVWNAKKQVWERPVRLGPRAMYYRAYLRVPDAFFSNRFFDWRVATWGGSRFDLKHFVVHARYDILRDPTTGATMPPPAGAFAYLRAAHTIHHRSTTPGSSSTAP